MSILLCLTNEGMDKLPNTQTKLCQEFVTITITHFLKKDKKLPTASIAELDDLNDPHNQIIKESAQFAFISLQRDQLVFTQTEVKAMYPNLTPANWFAEASTVFQTRRWV